MAGELWRGVVGIAKEVTYGTAVSPPTRKAYLEEPSLTDERESQIHRVATGTRDNVRAITQGPQQVGGQVRFLMSPAEILEWLLVTIKGGVTSTTPGGATLARLWTFTPGTALDSLTMEWADGARSWVGAGIYGNQMTIAGAVNAENTVTFDLFGTSRAAITPSTMPADRAFSFLQGWQAKLYIDALGGTPGTTNVPLTMIDWNVVFNNNAQRHYFADNTKAAGEITVGELEVTASITFRAASAQALTEYTNWDTDASRLVRLEFLGAANDIESGQTSKVTIDLPGKWSTPNLAGDSDGIRAYSFDFNGSYDSVNGYGFQIRALNSRTVAWGAT